MFPSIEYYLGLVTVYLIEYMENQANKYAYIKPEGFSKVLNSSLALSAN